MGGDHIAMNVCIYVFYTCKLQKLGAGDGFLNFNCVQLSRSLGHEAVA